eukprot:g4231.t1
MLKTVLRRISRNHFSFLSNCRALTTSSSSSDDNCDVNMENACVSLADAIGASAYEALLGLMSDKKMLTDHEALCKRMDELTVELFGESFEANERAKMDADTLKIVDAFDEQLQKVLPEVVGTDGSDGVNAEMVENELALARELVALDDGGSSPERVVNGLWNCGLDIDDNGEVIVDERAPEKYQTVGRLNIKKGSSIRKDANDAGISRYNDVDEDHPDAPGDDGMGAGFKEFFEKDGGKMKNIIERYYERWAQKHPEAAHNAQTMGTRLSCTDLDDEFLSKSPALDMFASNYEDEDTSGVEEFEGGKTKGVFFEPKQAWGPPGSDRYGMDGEGEDVLFTVHSNRGVRKLLELEQWYQRFDKWMHYQVSKVKVQNDFQALLMDEPEYIGNARLQYEFQEYHGARQSELEVHPNQRKVSLKVHVPALGLSEKQTQFLAKLCGPRYNTDSKDLTLVSRKHKTMLQNRVHTRIVLGKVIQEAKKMQA